MTHENLISKANEMQEILDNNNIYGDVWWDDKGGMIIVQIEGDWKHAHARAAVLFSMVDGVEYMSSHQLNDSEDDYYCAEHRYMLTRCA